MNDESGDRPAATGPERVRTWVREDFALDLASIDEVEHGADEAAELWRGVSSSGTPYAVKLSGGGTPAGLVVSAHLSGQEAQGVPGPLPTRQGRLWSEREGRRLSVVPWVSGDRALDGGMSAAHWTAYGALLAQVHATAVTDALAQLLPREDHTHEQLASTTRALDGRLRAAADAPAGEAGPADHLTLAPGRSGWSTGTMPPSPRVNETSCSSSAGCSPSLR